MLKNISVSDFYVPNTTEGAKIISVYSEIMSLNFNIFIHSISLIITDPLKNFAKEKLKIQ